MASNRTVSLIGLGYVGLPVAIAFGKKHKTIAFDINAHRVAQLQKGVDHTSEVSSQEFKEASHCVFTANPEDLKHADFHIVAVPTPIDDALQPDLTPLLSASKTIGGQLKKGDIVVYESTVYPGATEEDCVPVLEKYSGLKCGVDFFVGYSPERIDPGNKEKTFTKILKIVSGQTPEIVDIVAEVYGSVVTAGVYKASSIKVAEAAKVIENTQRDINIALINELAVLFNRMGIDTNEVLAAAATKWNFLPFKPGLVGGHCIGVDPYYLTHKAIKLGLHPEVILAGRRINDSMGKYIAEQTIKQMIRLDKPIHKSRVAILGLTFKENCSDIRNTKVIDIYKELQNYHIEPLVHDPLADPQQALHEYGITLQTLEQIDNVEAVIIAVSHTDYQTLPIETLIHKIKGAPLLIDVKNMISADQIHQHHLNVWKL
jgi:UDP-N-acetyl-D-galactosamine dehydrogenase